MLPFMEEEMCRLLKSIAENFIKAKKLGDNSTVGEILAIDFVKDGLNKLNLTDQKLREFKYQCLLGYKAVIAKIKQRMSHETIQMMTSMSSLSPRYIVNHPNSCINRFEYLLMSFIQKYGSNI